MKKFVFVKYLSLKISNLFVKFAQSTKFSLRITNLMISRRMPIHFVQFRCKSQTFITGTGVEIRLNNEFNSFYIFQNKAKIIKK